MKKAFLILPLLAISVITLVFYLRNGDKTRELPFQVVKVAHKKSGSVPKSQYLDRLLRLTPKISEDTIVRILDQLSANRVGDTLLSQVLTRHLRESSELYKGRGPQESMRLRTHLLVSLSRIGPVDDCLPFIIGELRHAIEVPLIAASARVAGKLEKHSKVLLPLLVTILEPNFKDDQISLDEYKASYPLRTPTSARLEVITALARWKAKALAAYPLLNAYAHPTPAFPSFYHKHLQRAAAEALTEISPLPIPMCENLSSHVDSITDFSSWSERLVILQRAVLLEERCPPPLEKIKFEDQNGAPFNWKKKLGKPSIITFLYTGCTNSEKCPLTASHLAKFQQRLKEFSLDDQVSIILISLDPVFDTPRKFVSFTESRGLKIEQNVHLLRSGMEDLIKASEILELNVNFGKGLVNAHSIDFLLLDKWNRVALHSTRTLWNDEFVLEQLKKLIEEDYQKDK